MGPGGSHPPLGARFGGDEPGTRAQDGDPLDVMLLGEEPAFTGCLVTARLLGVIEAEQKQGGKTIRNDRLIATAETEKIRPAERSLADVAGKILDQIEHFFAAYNRYEGRESVPLRRRGPEAAQRLVDNAVRARRRPWSARLRRARQAPRSPMASLAAHERVSGAVASRIVPVAKVRARP